MNKLTLAMVMMLSLLATNETCWSFGVTNGTKKTIEISIAWKRHTHWLKTFCPEKETITLPPGHSGTIAEGVCEVYSISVTDKPGWSGPVRWFEDNPVDGLRVIEQSDGSLAIVTNNEYAASMTPQERKEYFAWLKSLEGAPEIGTFGQKNPKGKL